MDDIRWFNPMQPDTLRNAVVLGYLEAFLTLIRIGPLGAASKIPSPILFLACVALAAGAVGCASEKKIGYAAAVGGASVVAVAHAINVLRIGGINLGMISLMFAGALLALLLHERTREYQRIWFN